ncbi:MAG: DUF4124 domain-containing protein [Bdellovibrionales bacterium]|nr:DUF4124 domain-containing protein [Bdellovibrionales bacterium]
MAKLVVYLICYLILGISFAESLLAAPVYTWTDESGVVHYSSTQDSKRAKPAELPEINRGEVLIKKTELVSCADHGGIDCQAGSDQDGSVICYDGFRGATARYRFTCASPKLQITDVSELSQDGSFRVTVRNSRSVEANSPAVLYTPDQGPEVSLSGPEKIGAFEVAEFLFTAKNSDIPKEKVTIAQLNVVCANCP